MKAILVKLTFLFFLFLTTHTIGQTMEGSYDNKEIYLNGLALNPDNNFSQNEIKEAVEYNLERTEWGNGIDWNGVEITAEEDDYYGFLTSYYYKILSSIEFALEIQGYPTSNYQSITYFSIDTPNIVVGFLSYKFIIGTTKKEEVEGLFYNGKVEKEYPSGSIRYTVYTHGGQLHFVFNKYGVLKSIYLQSF